MSTEKNVRVKNIRKFDHLGNVKAYVDIVVCKFLEVRNCRLVEGENGLFVSLPQAAGKKENKYFPINKPHTKEAYKEIKDAVLTAYNAKATIAASA